MGGVGTAVDHFVVVGPPVALDTSVPPPAASWDEADPEAAITEKADEGCTPELF